MTRGPVERPDLAAAYRAVVESYAARAAEWEARGCEATAAAYRRCAAPLLAQLDRERSTST